MKILAVDPHEKWAARRLWADASSTSGVAQIPLLLDPSLVASGRYGVAFQMRIHVERSSRPATFVIDREGVLRYERRAQSFADRPKTSELLEILRKL